MEGYYGLSDRVFYSRVFDGKPQSSVQPRYVNIRVEIPVRGKHFDLIERTEPFPARPISNNYIS